MSDGPHRSLPMRPAWRQVAMRAEKRAWSAEDVGDSLCFAVSKDYKREVRAEFLTALNTIIGADRQYTMFAEHGTEQLAELRAVTANGSFEESIIDYMDIALRGGRSGEAAWQEALQTACQERVADCSRSVEEHYKRKASPKAAEQIRGRLEQGLRSQSFKSIAANLLERDGHSAVPRVVSKDRSLDAGPVLGK